MATEPTPAATRALCRVLSDATRGLRRHRLRTRLSVFAEAARLWREEGEAALSDDALQEALAAELDRLVEAKLVAVGGPTGKRVQLTPAGQAYVADVLRGK